MGNSPLTTAQTRRIRRRLYNHDPRCHWCKVVTILPEDLPRRKDGNVVSCKSMATLDHIHSKWKKQYHPKCVVLACTKCNNERNEEEHKLIPKAERHKRSKEGELKANKDNNL